jgi:hypothetical protein
MQRWLSIFCHLWSFILLSVIVFADLFKLLMIRDSSYCSDESGAWPWPTFPWDYTNLSVWYKLIDKTYYGAYISIVER